MLKKVQIYEFDPVLYPRKLWVVVTQDMKVITDRFLDKKSKGEMVYNGDMSSYHAVTQLVINKDTKHSGIIIVFRSKASMTVNIIAHESTHAARSIWNEIGEDEAGIEADAYLVGWIAECCEKVKLNKE